MDKKVSIIVPSYKRDKTMFSRAIESLLNQSYDNIEIIVVDDNAREEHTEYRQALARYISNLASEKIKYIINSTNLGGAQSRNVGIEASSGDYITFLDDDDRYLPNKVLNQLTFMVENELEMSFTNIVIVDANDKVVDYREHSGLKSYDNNTLMEYHLMKQITATNTFMYKREAILRIGGFVNVPMGQEYYLMYNTIDSGIKIGYLNSNDTLLYRQGQECISNGANKLAGEIKLYNFKKSHFDRLSLRKRAFVRFRHNAVMTVIHLRQKNIFKAIGRLILTGLVSPIDFLIQGFNFLFNRGVKVDIESPSSDS